MEIIDTTSLTESAVDLWLNPETKEYELIHIKYNPISGFAKITEHTKAGSFRLAGTNTFKMELVKLGKV